jgi:hypothetical protein
MSVVMNDVRLTKRCPNVRRADVNAQWESSDSPRQATLVGDRFARQQLAISSRIGIGCGAGERHTLRDRLRSVRMSGHFTTLAILMYRSWHTAAYNELVPGNVSEAHCGPVHGVPPLAAIERLGDPGADLDRLRRHVRYMVFRIPLEGSATSVCGAQRLLWVRRRGEYRQWLCPGLALPPLNECGHEVIDACHTGAAFCAPSCNISMQLAEAPRRLLFVLLVDREVRLPGERALPVLARPGATT